MQCPGRLPFALAGGWFAAWLGAFSTLAWLAHPALIVPLAAPTFMLYLSRLPVQRMNLRLALVLGQWLLVLAYPVDVSSGKL